MKILKSIILVAAALLLTNVASAQEKVGLIKAFLVKGEVTLVNNTTGATSPLRRGQEFSEGHTVITGESGTTLLLFSNGASINVAPGSKFNVNNFEQAAYDPALGSFLRLQKDPSLSTTETNLEYGEIIGEVRKLNLDVGSSFTVNTPVASAGIRGTVWVVSYNVETGEFTTTNVNGAVSVTLPDGTVVDVPEEQSYTIVNFVGDMSEADQATIDAANTFAAQVSVAGQGPANVVVNNATVVTTPNTAIITEDTGTNPSPSEP